MSNSVIIWVLSHLHSHDHGVGNLEDGNLVPATGSTGRQWMHLQPSRKAAENCRKPQERLGNTRVDEIWCHYNNTENQQSNEPTSGRPSDPKLLIVFCTSILSAFGPEANLNTSFHTILISHDRRPLENRPFDFGRGLDFDVPDPSVPGTRNLVCCDEPHWEEWNFTFPI